MPGQKRRSKRCQWTNRLCPLQSHTGMRAQKRRPNPHLQNLRSYLCLRPVRTPSLCQLFGFEGLTAVLLRCAELRIFLRRSPGFGDWGRHLLSSMVSGISYRFWQFHKLLLMEPLALFVMVLGLLPGQLFFPWACLVALPWGSRPGRWYRPNPWAMFLFLISKTF